MRRLMAGACVAVIALAMSATPASAKPSTKQLASIVAGHKQSIEDDAAAENSSTDLFVQSRMDRATADARDSLALATELERAAGKKAQKAPGEIRSLVKATIKQARAVASHAQRWLDCLDMNAGGQVQVCDGTLGYLDDVAAWPALLDRWGPYLS